MHIDVDEKSSLTYPGSLFYPIKFPFLPVYRIAFCQCNREWSGRYCTIEHACMCSSDSICIGVSAYHRSVCVCPINKFGDRYLLIDTICQMDKNLTCQHDGQYIPSDEYMISNQKFERICPKGYIGDRCEIIDNKIILSFGKTVILITAKSRQKSNLQTNQSFLTLLKEQIRQHKNLFTAPILLIILALPRLILLFVAKCMKSTNDTWLLLIGYFISFIPPMLTFIVFILPSKFDKQQLHKSLVACRTRV
ncbi:unnamed protein product [Rotaria sp. Silwood1]|nr:unnamed protein product [Rotaria sp. Silwood1]CAF1451573.1 unnamed protein product [Rotaria sp. Silwood1]